MSIRGGNEGGSVWVHFSKNISQGPFNSFSFLLNIVTYTHASQRPLSI